MMSKGGFKTRPYESDSFLRGSISFAFAQTRFAVNTPYPTQNFVSGACGERSRTMPPSW